MTSSILFLLATAWTQGPTLSGTNGRQCTFPADTSPIPYAVGDYVYGMTVETQSRERLSILYTDIVGATHDNPLRWSRVRRVEINRSRPGLVTPPQDVLAFQNVSFERIYAVELAKGEKSILIVDNCPGGIMKLDRNGGGVWLWRGGAGPCGSGGGGETRFSRERPVDLVFGDIDGDGRVDIVPIMFTSDGGLFWLKNPGDERQQWTKNVIDPDHRPGSRALAFIKAETTGIHECPSIRGDCDLLVANGGTYYMYARKRLGKCPRGDSVGEGWCREFIGTVVASPAQMYGAIVGAASPDGVFVGASANGGSSLLRRTGQDWTITANTLPGIPEYSALWSIQPFRNDKAALLYTTYGQVAPYHSTLTIKKEEAHATLPGLRVNQATLLDVNDDGCEDILAVSDCPGCGVTVYYASPRASVVDPRAQ